MDLSKLELKYALMTALQADAEQDYDLRNVAVFKALYEAATLGYPTGFEHDELGLAGFQTVAYIELPTGQVSWHMRDHTQEWDMHTVFEKRDRIRNYLAS